MREWTQNLLLALVAVFAPVQSMLLAVGALIAIDFVTGVWRAVKQHEPITSTGFRRSIAKMVAYQLAVISAFVLERYMLADALPAAKIVASVVGITEVKSIFENLRLITGIDLWAQVLTKIQGARDAPK